ncbi:hypothetical protein Peur_038096 [Populus x canadensis]|jgi:hypothetical protein
MAAEVGCWVVRVLLLPGLFPKRGGARSWLLGLRLGRFLVVLMLVVGGEEVENKKGREEERKRKDGFGWWFAGFWRIDREGE